MTKAQQKEKAKAIYKGAFRVYLDKANDEEKIWAFPLARVADFCELFKMLGIATNEDIHKWEYEVYNER